MFAQQRQRFGFLAAHQIGHAQRHGGFFASGFASGFELADGAGKLAGGAEKTAVQLLVKGFFLRGGGQLDAAAVVGIGFGGMAGLVEIVADPMETGAYRQRSQVGGGCFGAAFGCGVFHHAVEYHAQGAQIGDGAAAVVFVVKTRRVVAGNRRQVADGGFNAAQIHADRRFFRIAADQAVRIQRAVGRGGKRQGECADHQRGECFFHIRLRFVR